MKSPLTYYIDKKMEKRVPVNEEGFPIIDWGETIPGKLKEMILYVKNESKDPLTFRQPYCTSEDLKVEDYPAQMKAGTLGLVKLRYRPNPDTIESHHASWGFQVIVGN